jgi:hypothetical protein
MGILSFPRESETGIGHIWQQEGRLGKDRWPTEPVFPAEERLPEGTAPTVGDLAGVSGLEIAGLALAGTLVFEFLPRGGQGFSAGTRLIVSYALMIPAAALLLLLRGRFRLRSWTAAVILSSVLKMVMTMGLHLLERFFWS